MEKAGWLGRDFTVKFYSGSLLGDFTSKPQASSTSESMDRVDGEKKTADIMYSLLTRIAFYCLVILPPLSDTWLMHIYYQGDIG